MDSDKEENGVAETSAFDQIIDDTSLQRPVSKKDDKIVKSRNPSPKASDDRRSSFTTGNAISNTNYTEDEITSASKNIDDFDDVYDIVEQFEE